MNEHNTAKKTFGHLATGCVWLVGIIVTLFVGGIVFLLLLFNGEEGRNDEYSQEKMLREKAFTVLTQAVQEYHNEHNSYPSHKFIRNIKDDALQKSLASRGVRYHRATDSTGEECYVIAIIDDVRMNWSGRRLSNRPECIGLPKDAEPNSSGTYFNILDLH